MQHFTVVCEDFTLNISLKKTQVMGQNVDVPPSINIHEYEFEDVHEFTNLGSTITDGLSLETELNRRIEKAATTFSTLTKRVDKQQAHRAHKNAGVQGSW